MKKYRCVFIFARGRTTIEVVAHDAAGAMSEAQLTVEGDPRSIEVWDETGMVSELNRVKPDRGRFGIKDPPKG